MAAKCPLCSTRAAKRHCPAKATKICPVCCGTKREVEIDCPSDCTYLQTGRSFESERRPSRRASRPGRQFDEQFLYRYAPLLATLAKVIVEERNRTPHVVDQDAGQAYQALKSTLNTLSSGLYYETTPENNVVAASLFARMKAVFDEMMQPQEDGPSLKVTEALDVVDFMISTAEFHSSGRPRSRKYLDWLATMVPAAEKQEEGSGLIVP